MNQELTKEQKIGMMNNQIQQLQSILAQQHVDLSDPNLFNDDYDPEPHAFDESLDASYDESESYELETPTVSKDFSEDTEVDLGDMF